MAFFDMFTIAGVISAVAVTVVIFALSAKCDCNKPGC